MTKSNIFVICFFVVTALATLGVANINHIHNNYEAEVEACIEAGGGYECF